MNLLLLYFETAAIGIVIFLLLDYIWVNFAAQKIYYRHLSYLSKVDKEKIIYKKPQMIASRIIISAAITGSVYMSVLTGGSISWSVSGGGIAGFALYSAYNLTCASFVRGWPLFITVLDISWGTLQGLIAGIYIFIITGYLAP